MIITILLVTLIYASSDLAGDIYPSIITINDKFVIYYTNNLEVKLYKTILSKSGKLLVKRKLVQNNSPEIKEADYQPVFKYDKKTRKPIKIFQYFYSRPLYYIKSKQDSRKTNKWIKIDSVKNGIQYICPINSNLANNITSINRGFFDQNSVVLVVTHKDYYRDNKKTNHFYFYHISKENPSKIKTTFIGRLLRGAYNFITASKILIYKDFYLLCWLDE